MFLRVLIVSVSAAVVIFATPLSLTSVAAQGMSSRSVVNHAKSDNVVLQWNSALLEAVQRTGFRPMWTARALAIVHTAIYDAWAAYDRKAVGGHWSHDRRRPHHERTAANKQVAISSAAYRTLIDLFPSEAGPTFDPLMADLGLDPRDDVLTRHGRAASEIAAAEVIAFRHGRLNRWAISMVHRIPLHWLLARQSSRPIVDPIAGSRPGGGRNHPDVSARTGACRCVCADLRGSVPTASAGSS